MMFFHHSKPRSTHCDRRNRLGPLQQSRAVNRIRQYIIDAIRDGFDCAAFGNGCHAWPPADTPTSWLLRPSQNSSLSQKHAERGEPLSLFLAARISSVVSLSNRTPTELYIDIILRAFNVAEVCAQ